MNYTPFQPKRLSRLQARVLQELIAAGREFPVSFANQKKILTFVEEVPIDSDAMRIYMRAGAHPLTVSISPALNGVIIQRISDFGGIDVLAEPFRQALIAVVSKELIDTLEHVLQFSIELRSGEEEVSNVISEKLFFKVHTPDGNLEATGVLELPAEIAERIVELARDMPVKEVHHPANWSIKGQVVIGTTRLTIGQLSELSVNSLVLIDEPCTFDSGTGHLLINGDFKTTMPLSVKELRGVIHSFEKVVERSPSLSQHEQQPEQEPLQPLVGEGEAIATTPVQVSEADDRFLNTEIDLAYVAGDFEMQIGDVDPISANSGTLAPKITYFQPVQILLDGKVIGAGIIVQIKKRYAVLITALEEKL